MLVFNQGTSRFNFRVAGIAKRDGRVLVHRAKHEAFWTFPGGRAEMGEETRATLSREIREETGVEAKVGRLVWLVENFFRYEGRDFHELGFYYLMDIDPAFPYHPADVVHQVVDGPNEIEFKWEMADASSLAALPLFPEFIPARIANLPSAPEHLVWRDNIPLVNQLTRAG